MVIGASNGQGFIEGAGNFLILDEIMSQKSPGDL
jgi:hypothetical protein